MSQWISNVLVVHCGLFFVWQSCCSRNFVIKHFARRNQRIVYQPTSVSVNTPRPICRDWRGRRSESEKEQVRVARSYIIMRSRNHIAMETQQCVPFLLLFAQISCQQYKVVLVLPWTCIVGFPLHCCRCTKYFVLLLWTINIKYYECLHSYLGYPTCKFHASCTLLY